VGGYILELTGPPQSAQRHLEFSIFNAANSQARVSTASFADANFHHVAVTVDRGANLVAIYLDGVSQMSQSAAGIGSLVNGSRLWVGHQTLDANTGVQPFRGLIDDLALYNRALSLLEIQAIYNAGGSGKCLTPVYITALSKSGNTVNLSWLAQPKLTYRVQYSTVLDAATWTDLSGDVAATGASASKRDILPPNAPQRFYRVMMFR
jgi:hypothetical protein